MTKLTQMAVVIASSGFIVGSASADEPLQIAAIGDISGRVMVYDGNAYSPAQTGMGLEAGDRVVTLKGASAQVAFQEGCTASLEENAVLAISGVDICALGVAQAEAPLMYAQAIGAPPAPAAGTAVTTSSTTAAAGWSTSAMVATGIAATGFISVATDSDSSRTPASPQ